MQAFHVDCVDSTNEEAKRLFHAGHIEHTAYVCAREQTAGKGNYGRNWHSPKDAGIYLSVIERAPREGAPPDTLFTAAAGVACAQVLREATGLDVRLKPVNDLFVADQKLGGILVDSLIESHRIRAVITGVGINTHEADRPVPKGSADPVSLQQLMGRRAFMQIDFSQLIASLVQSVLEWNQPCWKGDSNEVGSAWNELAMPGARLPV